MASDGNETHNFIQYKIINSNAYKHRFTNQILIRRENNNPIYHHLKANKIFAEICEKIGIGNNWIKKQRKPQRSKTEQSDHRFISRMPTEGSYENLDGRHERKRAMKMKEIDRVKCFTSTLKQFHNNFNISKSKISILDKYNKATQQFEAKLPEDPGEQTRQSMEQNELLLQLCKEEYRHTSNSACVLKKAEKMKKFREPSITPKFKKIFMNKRKSFTVSNFMKTRNEFNNKKQEDQFGQ